MPESDAEMSVREAFKRAVQALVGADKHLDQLESSLKVQLTDARNETREALQSLRDMAEQMQWRVQHLEDEEERRR